MPVSQLPAELWYRILAELKQPIPQPLSCPPRSKLFPTDLAIAARVCHLFTDICGPLIYANLVLTTTSLKRLMSAHLPPTRPLLHATRSIHIEYDTYDDSPSYVTLCAKGRLSWALVGRKAAEAQKTRMRRMAEDVKSLTVALDNVSKVSSMRDMFPRLETMAIGSIYGELDAWNRYSDQLRSDTPDDEQPMDCWATFLVLLQPSTLRHLCVRDSLGPLSVPPATHDSKLPKSTYSLTNHFTANAELLPVRYGGKVRWVSDVSASSTKWEDIKASVEERLDEQKHAREEYLAENRSALGDCDLLDLEIFCMTDDALPAPPLPGAGVITGGVVGAGQLESYREMLAARLGDAAQKRFRKDSGLLDQVKWFSSINASPCEACGSLPPP